MNCKHCGWTRDQHGPNGQCRLPDRSGFNPNAYFRPKQAACEVQRRRWARIKTWPRVAR